MTTAVAPSWGYEVYEITDRTPPRCMAPRCTQPSTQHVLYLVNDQLGAEKFFCRVHSPSTTLTAQDQTLLRCISEGKTDDALAAVLQVPLAAARVCLGRLYGKLGARNRTHAVALAIRRKLFVPPLVPVRPVLTEREMQVLAAFSEGRQLLEIGESLELSPDTIKTYARRVYRKFGAVNRSHAVALAFGAGVLS